jgi:hypothetical protein
MNHLRRRRTLRIQMNNNSFKLKNLLAVLLKVHQVILSQRNLWIKTILPLIPLAEGFHIKKSELRTIRKGVPPPTPVKTAIKKTDSSLTKAPIPPMSSKLKVEKSSDMSFAVKVDAWTAPVIIPFKDPPPVNEQLPPLKRPEIEKVDVPAVVNNDVPTAQDFIRKRIPHSMKTQLPQTTIHKSGGADVPTVNDAPVVTIHGDSPLGKAPIPQVKGLKYIDCCVIL